ncbi:hypothetical protein SNEBB_006868 [Seison nebaliae]|nr:hypothetical protein SNEBB_006868 [Seison nebaliae]
MNKYKRRTQILFQIIVSAISIIIIGVIIGVVFTLSGNGSETVSSENSGIISSISNPVIRETSEKPLIDYSNKATTKKLLKTEITTKKYVTSTLSTTEISNIEETSSSTEIFRIESLSSTLTFRVNQTQETGTNNEIFPKECGKSSKVIGGEIVEENVIPFIVLIKVIGKQNIFTCGGSIIHKNWILTAGHCTKGITYENINLTQIIMGNTRLDIKDEGEFQLGITGVFNHPNYNSTSYQILHDIALIRLNESIVFSEYVQPVCVGTYRPQVNDTVYLAGWGEYISDEGLSTYLRRSELTIGENEQCYLTEVEALSGFCTTSNSDANQPCQGDSGGPVYKYEERFTLYGIVSYGFSSDCTLPSVHATASDHLSWILTTIQNFDSHHLQIITNYL